MGQPAVEVARSLPDHPPPGQAIAPVPESLSEVVAARLARLPDLARRVLLPVAVLRHPTVDLVAAGICAPYTASELALELTPPDQIVDVERRSIQAAEYRRHASKP